MSSTVRRVVGVVARVSPRHRRWAAILARCTLDLDAQPDPLPPVGPDDVVICGSPRTGTALLTAMLFQPPTCVSVMEPWDGLRLPPHELFASLRQEVSTTGALTRGRLDLRALREEGRTAWVRDGDSPADVDFEAQSLLAVKYPGFWRYLDRLPGARFLVCVRDPVATVRSFRTTGGRLAEGLQYDVPFERSLNQRLLAEYATPLDRRVGLYDAINEAVLPHIDRPDVLVVRYEHWFDEPRTVLDEISSFLERDLTHARAVIRLPSPVPEDEESDAVRAMCRTGARLGYPG